MTVAPERPGPDRPELVFGEGKVSGVLPDARAAYPMALIRWLVQLLLAAAIILGLVSVVLSRRRARPQG